MCSVYVTIVYAVCLHDFVHPLSTVVHVCVHKLCICVCLGVRVCVCMSKVLYVYVCVH